MCFSVFKCEASLESRCDISCNHSRFYRQSPRSTARISQVLSILPSTRQNESSCYIFFERRFTCFASISSLIQSAPRTIYKNCRLIIGEHHKNFYIFSLSIYSPSSDRIELLVNCFIWDGLQSSLTGQLRFVGVHIDSDRLTNRDILSPIDRLYQGKKSIKISTRTTGNLYIYFVCNSTSEIDLHQFFEFSCCICTSCKTVFRSYF